MTDPTHHCAITQDLDDAPFAASAVTLLVPWIATGRATPQDVRVFTAALARDPAYAGDLAAARCEHLAFQALMEEGGRPSQRPLIDLFAAIEATQRLTEKA